MCPVLLNAVGAGSGQPVGYQAKLNTASYILCRTAGELRNTDHGSIAHKADRSIGRDHSESPVRHLWSILTAKDTGV